MNAEPPRNPTEPAGSHFELRKLFLTLDAERQRQHLSWSALARRVGVSASTMRRLADADDAEADGVLLLLRWLAATPEDYVVNTTVTGRPLPPSDGGFIRVDMELVALANGESGGARGRTRTSIQRLVQTAQRSLRPVGSFTRVSQV